MSIMVNLLPREVALRRAQRRTVRASGAAVMIFAVALGGLHMMRGATIAQAEAERDAVQAQVVRLEAEVAQLEPFRLLADELEARNTLLASAMASEVSHARILNDLSLAFPAASSMRSLTIAASNPEADSAATAGQGIDPGASVATVSYQGYSTERVAPGVEAVLVEFDKVRSFFGSFIETAAVEAMDATDVTTFTGTVRLDDAALTHRYADGLPEELSR